MLGKMAALFRWIEKGAFDVSAQGAAEGGATLTIGIDGIEAGEDFGEWSGGGGGAKGGCAVEGVIPHYGVDIGACSIHEIAAGTTVNMHIDEAGTDIESGGINDFRLLGEF